MLRRLDDPRGFSLVELTIIVAVLAIVGALAAPKIGRADSSVLRAAAQQFAADLQLIQNEAMTHGDAVRLLDLKLDDGTRYTLMNTDSDATSAPDAEKLQNVLTNRTYEVTFGEGPYAHLRGVWIAKSNTGPEGHIRFGRYGQVINFSEDPTIVLACGNQTLNVTIDRDLGDVTIGSSFGNYANLSAIAIPGPAGDIVEAVSPW